MKATKLIATLGSLMVIAGCQTLPYQPQARQVKVQPKKGGVIALNPSHRPEDRQLATQMMATNCGDKKVEVTEEGEVVTGQKTETQGNSYDYNRNNAQTTGSGIRFYPAGSTSMSANTTTVQTKEWQISYQCM